MDRVESWAELTAEVEDALRQAERRLARPGATHAPAIARERLERQFRASQGAMAGDLRLTDARGVVPSAALVARSMRGFLNDLLEHLHRDLVRADRDARRARFETAAIRRGMVVRARLPNGDEIRGRVLQVVGGRRAKVLTSDGALWSVSVDDVARENSDPSDDDVG